MLIRYPRGRADPADESRIGGLRGSFGQFNAGLSNLRRQSVFGQLAGCEDVHDAERLCRGSAMRWVLVHWQSAGLPHWPADGALRGDMA